MNRRLPGLAVIGVLAILLNACAGLAQSTGAPSPAPTESASDSPAPRFPNPTNFTDAIGGNKVSSIAEAASDVPFSVLTPSGLGDPVGMYVTDPGSSEPPDRVVELDYQTSPYGQVDVEETTPTIAPDRWGEMMNELVAQNGNSLLHGSYAIIKIRGGVSALLLTSEDGVQSEIRWLESDSLEMIVRGPTLSQDQCETIANKI